MEPVFVGGGTLEKQPSHSPSTQTPSRSADTRSGRRKKKKIDGLLLLRRLLFFLFFPPPSFKVSAAVETSGFLLLGLTDSLIKDSGWTRLAEES